MHLHLFQQNNIYTKLKYLIITAIRCYTAVNYIILYGAQTSVCVTNYVHIYKRTTLMFLCPDSQQ